MWEPGQHSPKPIMKLRTGRPKRLRARFRFAAQLEVRQLSAAEKLRLSGGVLCGKTENVSTVDERHLKRLLTDYVCYYKDRTHLGLNKRTQGAEFVPSAAVAGWRSLGSAVCTTVTNGPQNPQVT